QVSSFQTLPSFPQQYPCYEDVRVLPEADHCQPPQYTINHPIFNAHNDFLNSQTKLMEQMTSLTSMCEMACQIIQKKQKEKKIEEEQVANARYWKIPACCDDDDNYNSAITPNEPIDSLKISSGSTTTHSDISLSKYDSFIFDPSNDQFPPTDRGDFTHEEFADELAHIISPPEYDCFYFRNLPDPGEWISILNSGIRENLFSTTRVNLPIEDDHSPLLAHVVWIFLAYLTYPVIPPYLHSFGNEDAIFDPCITINHFYSVKPGSSRACDSVNENKALRGRHPMLINS
nr:hypothetical protein [Tanacetum cinerariifolium]